MEDYNSNFNFTKTAIIITTVSGSISFISSMLIIYVILKSPKLVFSTPYHRIMFGISIGDCIVSFAIALTTIPMPKDVIYPFAQPSYGNIHTCNAQAYVQIGGSGATFWMSMILYIYYGCSLVFHMKDVTFRKWIETPSVTFIVLLFFSPLLYLKNVESLNPSPTCVWCTRRGYPDQCTNDTDPDCREEGRGNFTAEWVTIALVNFAILLVDMCLIVFSFYRAEWKLKQALRENDNSTKGDMEQFDEDELRETRRDKRRITKEALMYIASFFVIWIFPVLYADLVEDQDDFEDIPVLAAFRLFFQPLQGLLNMLIFFYHKMEILKGKDKSLSIRERFKMVLLNPGEALEEKRMVISNLPVLDVSTASNEIELPSNRKDAMLGESPNASERNEEHSCLEESVSTRRANLYSDLGMTSLASSSCGVKRNDTDKFQLSLSQGESLSSSLENESGYHHYSKDMIKSLKEAFAARRPNSYSDHGTQGESQAANGHSVGEEDEDLSFRKMKSVAEEEEYFQ